MFALMRELFPLCRSLTGNGVRETLGRFSQELPGFKVVEVPSGTECFDWTVPQEWNVQEAYLEDPQGCRVVDFRESNLSLVGYSLPFEGTLSLEELQPHLYSLPEQPDSVPYVTSYYAPRWGFCLSHRQRERLQSGQYHVVIRTSLAPGSLTYGEWFLPGAEATEVLLSTYVCHPSLANDNLSGPVLQVALAKWLASKPRRLSYRLVFVPETIGAIVYIHRHLADLKARVQAGFVLTCVGDDRCFSYLPSRKGNTMTDRICRHVLAHEVGSFKEYSFLDRGSDERQYCSPGVDLPVASIMRSKYGTYPEYHTSGDNLGLVSPKGLGESFAVYTACLEALEQNRTYRTAQPCEPQLGKRGLYPTLSMKGSATEVRLLRDLLALADGHCRMLDIAEQMGVDIATLYPVVEKLVRHGLLVSVGDP